MPADLESLQLSEIERRNKPIDVSGQLNRSVQGGLAAANQAVGTVDAMEQREKAREFQKILEGGKETAIAHYESLPPEMKKMIGLTPEMVPDENIITYYKAVAEAEQRMGLAGAVESGASSKDLLKQGVMSGDIGAKPLVEMAAGREQAEAKAAKEEALRTSWSKFLADPEIQKLKDEAAGYGEDAIKARNRLASMASRDFQNYSPAEKFIDDIKNSRQPYGVGPGEQRRLIDSLVKRRRAIVKDLDDKLQVGEAYKFLNQVFPGGIYGNEDPASVGLAGKTFRDFWIGEENAKIRAALASITNTTLREQSGLAVTEPEALRVMDELGITNKTPAAAFKEIFQNKIMRRIRELKRIQKVDTEILEEMGIDPLEPYRTWVPSLASKSNSSGKSDTQSGQGDQTPKSDLKNLTIEQKKELLRQRLGR